MTFNATMPIIASRIINLLIIENTCERLLTINYNRKFQTIIIHAWRNYFDKVLIKMSCRPTRYRKALQADWCAHRLCVYANLKLKLLYEREIFALYVCTKEGLLLCGARTLVSGTAIITTAIITICMQVESNGYFAGPHCTERSKCICEKGPTPHCASPQFDGKDFARYICQILSFFKMREIINCLSFFKTVFPFFLLWDLNFLNFSYIILVNFFYSIFILYFYFTLLSSRLYKVSFFFFCTLLNFCDTAE